MRRSKLIRILMVVLCGVAIVSLLLLQARRLAMPTLRAGFPTTRASDGRAMLFSIHAPSPILLVPPDTWYALGQGNGAPIDLSGHFSSMNANWGFSRAPSSGIPARGDGMIFIPVLSTLKNAPTAPTIRVLDELSHANLRTIAPPTLVTQALWCEGTLVAAGDHDVYAFDPADDRLLWSFQAPAKISTAMINTNGAICMGIEGNEQSANRTDAPALLSVDRKSGQLLWRARMPHVAWGTPAFDGDVIYCASVNPASPYSQGLSALDARTGALKWESADFDALSVESSPGGTPWRQAVRSPAVGPGVICIPLVGKLYGIDSQTGKMRWEYSVERSDPSTAPKYEHMGPPVVRDGIAFVTVADGLRAVDCRSGKEAWHYDNPNPDHTRWPSFLDPPQIAGNVLVVPFRDYESDVVRLPVHAIPSIPSLTMPIKPALAIAGLCALAVAIVAAFFLKKIKALCALVSLTLCAMTTWAWMTSYNASHFLGSRELTNQLQWAQTDRGVKSAQGGITIGMQRSVFDRSFAVPTQSNRTQPLVWTRTSRLVSANGACIEEPAADLGLTHFAWTHRSRSSGTSMGNQAETSLTLPHWFVVVMLAILPFAWLSGPWRDRRRFPVGHCTRCGYDLRASADRCPECGEAVGGKNSGGLPG